MEASTEEIVTVLVLADDLDVAEWYRLKLELDGYKVRIVPRTLEPIELREYVVPDLLVLDVKPVPRDAAVFNRVRSHAFLKDVPAILLSSQRADKLSRAGFTLAPIDYIVAIPPAAPSVRTLRGRGADEDARTATRWSFLDRPEPPIRHEARRSRLSGSAPFPLGTAQHDVGSSATTTS